jgi:hypothetical protein
MITGDSTARLFLDNIYCLHGFPNDIVSNQGPQFISKFWKGFFELLKVKIDLWSAYHLETDGQTKRVNQILEQYLQCTINYHQNNWVGFLPLAEFAYNNTLQSSIMVNILKEIFFK